MSNYFGKFKKFFVIPFFVMSINQTKKCALLSS
jgi:hypothetical protein